jgi:hypothetical protein
MDHTTLSHCHTNKVRWKGKMRSRLECVLKMDTPCLSYHRRVGQPCDGRPFFAMSDFALEELRGIATVSPLP